MCDRLMLDWDANRTAKFSDVTVIEEYDGVRHFKASVEQPPMGAIGARCDKRTVRSATGSQAIASEMEAWKRARMGRISGLLSGVFALFPEGDTVHFIYEHFDLDLQQYAKEMGEIVDSNGVMKPAFKDAMRQIFYALHNIHIERGENHNNLKLEESSPLNIVVVKGCSGGDKVLLTGLRDQTKDSLEFRSQDCHDLADILTTLVRKYSADDVILPLWFEALMRHLKTLGCRNLHNSIIFKGMDQKMQYLSNADLRLRYKELSNEFDKVMLNLMCKTSKDGSWNPREHIMNNPNFSYVFQVHYGGIPYTSIATCFLRYCFMIDSACDDIVLPWSPVQIERWDTPSSENYKRVESMWPEYFCVLHEALTRIGIFMYED